MTLQPARTLVSWLKRGLRSRNEKNTIICNPDIVRIIQLSKVRESSDRAIVEILSETGLIDGSNGFGSVADTLDVFLTPCPVVGCLGTKAQPDDQSNGDAPASHDEIALDRKPRHD